MVVRGIKFGELKKGDRFTCPLMHSLMIKTARIKDGTDGAFYTAIDINTGVFHKINDDTEVYTFPKYEVDYGKEVDLDSVVIAGFVYLITKDSDDSYGDCVTLTVLETEKYTFEDILYQYPEVDIIIVETPLSGTVYKHDAYGDGKLRIVGKTMGYA